MPCLDPVEGRSREPRHPHARTSKPGQERQRSGWALSPCLFGPTTQQPGFSKTACGRIDYRPVCVAQRFALVNSVLLSQIPPSPTSPLIPNPTLANARRAIPLISPLHRRSHCRAPARRPRPPGQLTPSDQYRPPLPPLLPLLFSRLLLDLYRRRSSFSCFSRTWTPSPPHSRRSALLAAPFLPILFSTSLLLSSPLKFLGKVMLMFHNCYGR
jgi:hypothetical protein